MRGDHEYVERVRRGTGRCRRTPPRSSGDPAGAGSQAEYSVSLHQYVVFICSYNDRVPTHLPGYPQVAGVARIAEVLTATVSGRKVRTRIMITGGPRLFDAAAGKDRPLIPALHEYPCAQGWRSAPRYSQGLLSCCPRASHPPP